MTITGEGGIAQIVAKWAAGQPFNNVVTAALLFVIGGSIYYDITIVKPADRQERRESIQYIENGHDKVVSKILESNERERQRDRDHMQQLINAVRGLGVIRRPLNPENVAGQ